MWVCWVCWVSNSPGSTVQWERQRQQQQYQLREVDQSGRRALGFIRNKSLSGDTSRSIILFFHSIIITNHPPLCLFCLFTRYKLLLEGMLKNTEKDHPDRPLLQNAIEQISDVASFINDSIKRRENQAKIWGTCACFRFAVVFETVKTVKLWKLLSWTALILLELIPYYTRYIREGRLYFFVFIHHNFITAPGTWVVFGVNSIENVLSTTTGSERGVWCLQRVFRKNGGVHGRVTHIAQGWSGGGVAFRVPTTSLLIPVPF